MTKSALFLTRKFPPSVGGMETLAAGVWRALEAAEPGAILVAHGGPNRSLPAWLPSALAKVVRRAASRDISVVLTGDAVMYLVASPLLRLLRVPTATMVMGLDVTYPPRWYQRLVRWSLRGAPRVLAISRATAEAARARGVRDDRLVVIPLGIQVPGVTEDDRARARRELGQHLGLGPDEIIVLTLGRVVRRKGAAWFVREVLPLLPVSVHYVVAGDGEGFEELRLAAEVDPDRVHLLGAVADGEREMLLRGADVFVQPNIPVPGDMEGFGLVTIEAAGRGTPVVAAALEGILDAVTPGVTGLLAEPGDPASWAEHLRDLLADRADLVAMGQRFRAGVLAHRSEAAMGAAILAALGSTDGVGAKRVRNPR